MKDKKKLLDRIPWAKLHRLADDIKQNKESFHTGIAMEHFIVGGYKQLSLLNKMRCRVILNELIKKDKDDLAEKVGYQKYRQTIREYEAQIGKVEDNGN